MKPKTILILILLSATVVSATVVVGIGGAVLYTRNAETQRQLDIARANIDALRDTLTMYGDSVTETRSLMQTQADVNNDSIRALLGSLDDAVEGRQQTLRALNTLRVTFRALREEFESVTVRDVPDVGEPGSEEASFEIAGPPIQGLLWVTYRPNAPWRLRTDLTPTPFDLIYSIGCDEMKRAIVNVTAPPWAPVTPTRGTISPDVCNPVTVQPIFSFSLGKAVWGLGGIAIGSFGFWVIDEFLLGGDENDAHY